MVVKARMLLRLLTGVLMCSVEALGSYYPKAIPTEAGGSICSLSRKLKDVAPWTQEKIAALRKTRDKYGSKLLDWQLHFHESPEYGVNDSILYRIRTVIETVNKEIKTLPAKAIRSGALAAASAGSSENSSQSLRMHKKTALLAKSTTVYMVEATQLKEGICLSASQPVE
ncbi:unnamed protein product [Trypanosoma congolense IL3000]|uniref:WGS project CAEQ00000000 data, annotated contig 2048 n=1 Tax=Trypanosoma congolense (strain IL3000) TaxID=1068625 RepID=F9WB16_TRYCI|nr:unnamed protein product [Trypanosoma congolense IL3000]